jgi:hypothetical protein
MFRLVRRKMPDDTSPKEKATSPRTRMPVTRDLLARSPQIAPRAVNDTYWVGSRNVVKTGDIVSMSEVHAIRFVCKNPTYWCQRSWMPTPRVRLVTSVLLWRVHR